MTDGVSKSVLLVLAGTSGAGKGSIARQLLDLEPVSATESSIGSLAPKNLLTWRRTGDL